jgi:2-keto-4-pentenoate hydratase
MHSKALVMKPPLLVQRQALDLYSVVVGHPLASAADLRQLYDPLGAQLKSGITAVATWKRQRIARMRARTD